MSRTYKDRRKSKSKGNQYPDRRTQLAIKHAINAYQRMILDMRRQAASVASHREMCSGHQYNNMCRLERSIKDSLDWVEIVHDNLVEDAHWLKKA